MTERHITGPCMACVVGLFEECHNPQELDDGWIIPCAVRFKFIEEDIVKRGPVGAPMKDPTEVTDPLSTGRKRAAQIAPIMTGMRCEWSGLKWAGGGIRPIVGCQGNTLAAVKRNEDLPEGIDSRGELQHGPDKSTLNNTPGVNLHRICASCVTGEMRLLTEDLRWVRADEIKVGDRLLGFTEQLKGAIFEPAVVTHVAKVREPSFRIHMKNGDVLTASHTHQWVASRPSDGHTDWFTTESFLNRYETKRQGHFTLRKFVEPWDETNTYEDGWLAGFLDGEGTLSGDHLSVSQSLSGGNEIAAAEMERNLLSRVRGRVNRQLRKGREGRKDQLVLRVVSLPDIMRILGMTRPGRLMAKWTKFLYEGNASRKRKYMKRGRSIVTDGIRQEIDHIEYIGETEVYSIETTAKTYIVEGYLSHNCHHRWHERNDDGYSGSRPDAHLQWVPDVPYWPHDPFTKATEEDTSLSEDWWSLSKKDREEWPVEAPPEDRLIQPPDSGILSENPFEEPDFNLFTEQNGEHT